MLGRSTSPLITLSAVLLALGVTAGPSLAADASVAPGNQVQVVEKDSVPDGDVDDPNKLYKVTPDEVAECMKAWDPQTQMSKAEFEASCKSSLKVFPENP